MLYQGSKSEGSWCLCINTVNDSTFAFNVTRNHLQGHEEQQRDSFPPADPADCPLRAPRRGGRRGAAPPAPPTPLNPPPGHQNRTGSRSVATRGWTRTPLGASAGEGNAIAVGGASGLDLRHHPPWTLQATPPTLRPLRSHTHPRARETAESSSL